MPCQRIIKTKRRIKKHEEIFSFLLILLYFCKNIILIFVTMRIFNHLFTFVALVCVGLLSACENDPATNNPQNDTPVITISDTTLDVSAEGGDYTIELSVSNAIGDVKVAAKSAAEWLTVKSTTSTSVVVNVAYNDEESARETTLTIKYPQAEDVVVSVTQAGKDGEPYTLQIKDVTYDKFVSDVTAQNDENYYVVYSSTVSYFQEMGIADADALLLDDYTFFSQYAGAYGMGLQEFMTQFGLVRQGDASVDWTGLVPAESYVVYVYGVKFSEDGSDYTVTTPIFHEVVETPMNELGSISFTHIMDVIDGPRVKYEIHPIDYDGYYATFVCDESHELFQACVNDLDNFDITAAQYWMTRVNSYMDYYGMTAQQVLEEECYKGIGYFEEVLQANSDYWVFVLPVDIVDGLPMLTSTVTMFNFTTGDVVASDMTFDINLNACYTRVLDFTVTPSTDENYSILILNKTALEGLTTDEEIIDYAVNGYWLDEYQGAYNYYNCYLRPETEYSILIFGYYGGVATTGLTRLDVKTEPVAAAENSVTGVVTYGPYDPVAISQLDSSYANYASYAGNFVMVHWLETASADYAGVYHYIYDTATVGSRGDQAIFDDLVYYSYYDVMSDAGAFDTEYVIAAVVQDYRGNYSDMVYSEPFTYTTDQLRDAQEFLDLMNGDTRSGKAQVSLVGRNEIKSLSKAK